MAFKSLSLRATYYNMTEECYDIWGIPQNSMEGGRRWR